MFYRTKPEGVLGGLQYRVHDDGALLFNIKGDAK